MLHSLNANCLLGKNCSQMLQINPCSKRHTCRCRHEWKLCAGTAVDGKRTVFLNVSYRYAKAGLLEDLHNCSTRS